MGVEFSDLDLSKPLEFLGEDTTVALRLQETAAQVPSNRKLEFPIFKARGVDGTYLVYLSTDKNSFGWCIEMNKCSVPYLDNNKIEINFIIINNLSNFLE